jgi:hypothetical protein
MLFTNALGRVYGSKFMLAYTSGPPTVTNLNALAAGVGAQFVTHLEGDFSTDITLTEVIAADAANPSNPKGTWTGANSGSHASPSPSYGTAAIIELAIPASYRGGKPKIFLPAGAVSYLQDPAHWTAGFIAALASDWSGFVSAVSGTAGIGVTITGQCTVSYYHGLTARTRPSTGRTYYVGTPRATPLVYLVSGLSVRAQLGSQRRRLGTP